MASNYDRVLLILWMFVKDERERSDFFRKMYVILEQIVIYNQTNIINGYTQDLNKLMQIYYEEQLCD